MTVFPQLLTGALSQYPVRRRSFYRTIVNTLEDGSRVVLADPNSAAICWDLSFEGISDKETVGLTDFFSSNEGRLRSFTFLDPCGNLLGWSEALDKAAWQRNSLLTVQGSIGDPLGTKRAATLQNGGAGQLSVGQEISVAGIVTCCFSCYVRSDAGQPITLTRTSGGASTSISVSVSSNWTRVQLSSSLAGAADTSVFQVLFAPGVSVEIFGLQVDAQPAASQYVRNIAAGGVYPATRFDMDAITTTATGPDQNTCNVQLITRVNG